MKDYKFDLGLEVNQSNLDEIRRKLDMISNWLASNMTSITSSAICLQGIINIVEDIQEELDKRRN